MQDDHRWTCSGKTLMWDLKKGITKYHGIPSNQCPWLVGAPFALTLFKLVHENWWLCNNWEKCMPHYDNAAQWIQSICTLRRTQNLCHFTVNLKQIFLESVSQYNYNIHFSNQCSNLRVNIWQYHLFTKMVKQNLYSTI